MGALGPGQKPFISVSPYLSLVATEVGVGDGAGVATGVGTAMVGGSSEAGLSLTLSWGAGPENRPDTLKLTSADRREQVLAFKAAASLHRSASARTTFPLP